MKGIPGYVLRDSIKADAPEIFDLLLNHATAFKHDHLDVSRDFVLGIAGAKECITVEKDGEVTGFFLVTEVYPGLHCQGHFVVMPSHWVGWKQDGVVEKWIDTVWPRYNVVKLKVTVQSKQVERDTGRRDAKGDPIRRLTPLGKLLKRLKFFRLWMQVDEYLVNGTLQNVIAYELRRQFWHRERKRNGV